MYAPPEPNEEEDNDEQGVVFTDVEELLGATEGQFSLPPHFSTGYIARGRQLLLWDSSTNPGDPDVQDTGTPKWTVEDDSKPTGCNCTAIRTRFAPVLESSEALLAALTLPKFKVRWIVGAERREAARALLIAECRTLPRDEEPANNKNREAAAHSSANENDFFSFDEEEEDAMSISADSEVFEYMRSGSELEVLNRFPRVKAVCMKYNTATPSSAPVERLFSLGGIVLSPRRNRLSDKRFERLLLMRYNRTFCTDVE
ncbi:uncharacterized protein LOC117551854 [Gymnodraco acuticeps]|uniref:Uncharacterized protein LOC117551854 n=1 Tax=Gymnodraco acuticeps TaxID=8218 RepID=A0A6P8UT38_GYMAC|nr:uncharacterized protein LOC117551854 [Gymnodraco acuticeps]